MPIASSLLNKPRLVKKLKDFYTYVQKNDGKVGTKTRGIDLNFNNACNLRCKYCFTNSPKGDHVKDYLDYKAIAKLADEADELGYFEFDLQGGELLLQPKKLFKVLEAIQPERFYMYLTTNGYYLDESMAKKLAEFKVSRVSVSIDSMDEKIHDEIRGRKESWKRAIAALEHVKNAGMDPYLNITVGHYNADTDHFKQLLDYSKQKKYKTLLNVAVPSGMWQNAHEVICDDNDRKYLRKIRKEYKNLVRNIWNPFDKSHEKILGCTTVNRIYVTPIGDVLVCPYVHIKIGNIFEKPLKEIIDNGFSIKYFREHSDLCLAGEDKNFISNFMTKSGQSIFKPALPEEIFDKSEINKGDYINKLPSKDL
jgi:MoaA/NifB/PqqE/SkfB family radical SAM enzyme